MIRLALALALAAIHSPAGGQPRPRPIALMCTSDLDGRIVQGRAYPRSIQIKQGRRWHRLPDRQAAWSCMPRDPRVRLPVDLD